jgi:transcriptional regulator with XRE-family HTH domain
MNEHPLVLLRHERGYTQVKLAAVSKVGLRTIVNIESGTHMPRFYVRAKILRALGVPFREHLRIFDPGRLSRD